MLRSPRRPLTAAVTASALAWTMSACGSADEQSTAKAAGASSSGTVKITDAQNKTVSIPKNPKKVVVMDWSSVRNLNDLGVKIDGVPKASGDLPKDLSKFKHAQTVGGVKEPDYEAISQMAPDLIVIGSRTGNPEVAEKMKKITPNVIDMSVRTKNPKQVMPLIEKRTTDLAKIFGKEADAKKQLADMNKSVSEQSEKAKASKRTAMFVQSSGGKLGYYGPGSRMGMIYEPFGFAPTKAPNKSQDAGHGQEISQEFFAKYNPGAIFVLDRAATIGEKSSASALENDLVASTKAAKDKKVVTVDGFSWYLATYAPGSVKQMVADAAKGL